MSKLITLFVYLFKGEDERFGRVLTTSNLLIFNFPKFERFRGRVEHRNA